MAKYWGVEEEDLVYRWIGADTRKQFSIYAALYKNIRYMAASILHRYFIHTNDFDDIRDDGVNHLFINMHRFDPEKGYTAYSYCQTILKNFFHEKARNKGKVYAITLVYMDIETPEFEYSYQYNPFEEESHYDFQPIFKRLEQARYTLNVYLADHKRMLPKQRQILQREAEFLLHTQEYLYEYRNSQGLNAKAIQEYATNKLRVNETTVQNLMTKHLGICAANKEYATDCVKDRWHLDLVDEDYPPETTPAKHKISRNIIDSHRQIEYKE